LNKKTKEKGKNQKTVISDGTVYYYYLENNNLFDSTNYLVFNSDSLYRAYKKRLNNMPFDKEHYDEQLKNPNVILFFI